MRVTTWNLNGIRSLKKSIENVLSDLSSDISCFQETKVSRSQLPETTALVDGYTSYFSYPRKQSGYSGVATYCKDGFSPEDAEEGLSVSLSDADDEYSFLAKMELLADNVTEFDHEGRIIVTYHLIKYEDEIRRLAVINVYCPRVDPEKLGRYLYKMRFCYRLELKVRELSEKGCSFIIVGDMNITFSTIDSCDPGDEEEFYSSKPRVWFRDFLNSTMPYNSERTGVVDAFRYFFPDRKEAYTCWHTATSARLNNYGTRIDYILLSSNLLPLLQSCELMTDYQGSDHCPVTSVFKCDSISLENAKLPSICTRLWPEFSGRQQKLQSFFQKANDVTQNGSNVMEPEPKKIKLSAKKTNQKSIASFFKTPTTQSKGTEEISPSSSVESLSVENYCFQMIGSSSPIPKTGDDDLEITSSFQSSAVESMLTGPPKPPLCHGHNVECVLRTVKKEGPTFGWQFYKCSFPADNSYKPDSSCDYFQWAKDVESVTNFSKTHTAQRVKSKRSPSCTAKSQKVLLNPKKSQNYKKNPTSSVKSLSVENHCSQIIGSDAPIPKTGVDLKTTSSSQSSAVESMLTGPPKPPLCHGHNVECVFRTVKKEGPTFGRQFFICSFSADSSCRYFQWAEQEESVSNFSKTSISQNKIFPDTPPSSSIESPNAEQHSSQIADSIAETLKTDKSSSSQSAAWKYMLTGPPKPPLCSGHKVESVLRTVKKKGPNFGKQFFMCSFPAGSTNNPNASCNFFQWAFPTKAPKIKKG